MMKAIGRLMLGIAATGVVGGLAAGSALGLDMQGTWTGKMICKGFDGERYVLKYEDSVLKITQTGNAIVVDFNNGSYKYSGNTIDKTGDTNSGEVGLSVCEAAGEVETGRATVKRGKLKGISIYRDGANENETCKWNYTRTDSADPGVAACAP